MRRRHLVGFVLVLLAACKGSSAPPPPPNVPHVDGEDVVAAPAVAGQPPPLRVVVDAAGALHADDKAALARAMYVDDPAPPPPAKPTDADDESGGTGTAMALDEGKMGKKDSDRAEGQYRMAKRISPRGRFDSYRAPTAAANDDALRRQAGMLGEVVATTLPAAVALAIDPKAKASAAVDAIRATEGSILVLVGGRERTLRLQFASDPARERDVDAGDDEVRPLIELRVSAGGVEVEGAGTPRIATAPDAAAIEAAIAKVRAVPRFAAATVDVLVADDLDAQHLVDVLVALDRAKLTFVGLGKIPGAATAQAKLRGHLTTVFKLESLQRQGDISMTDLRAAIATVLPTLRKCYETALATMPDLEGEATVNFFIEPKGRVVTAAGSRLTPEAASCMAATIKAMTFGPIRGGGGVQVNTTFLASPHL